MQGRMRLDSSNGQTERAEGTAWGMTGAKAGRHRRWLRATPWAQLTGAGSKDRSARLQSARLGHLDER